MKLLSSFMAVVFVVGLTACSNQKPAAEAAVKAAQDSFNPVSAEGQKYVPEQTRAIQNAISSAQAALNNKDYAAALSQAQAIPAQVTALSSAITAKKTELTTAWTNMSAGLPKLLEALKSRVDILAKSKGVPAGVTKEAVEQAKTSVPQLMQQWSEASSAAASGDVATAVSTANDLRTKVVNTMKSLNMQVPAGAGG